ncbi:MAG: hypothetical protein VW642_09400, partial [Halieaceae bacterium]
AVTRAATAIGKYPYPLAYLQDGIVLKAVCGFRGEGLCSCRSGSTLRYLAGHRHMGFVVVIWRASERSGRCLVRHVVEGCYGVFPSEC